MTMYAIDVAHSSISFSIKHMMISKIKGAFISYSAIIETDNLLALDTTTIVFELDVASVSTRDSSRDQHLTSADFFHTDRFPKITFRKTAAEQYDGIFYITGDLTIKDVTKPITFKVDYAGLNTNPWGVEVYGFSCTGQINRKEFNLVYNAALESGGFLIDENVEITVDLELSPT